MKFFDKIQARQVLYLSNFYGLCQNRNFLPFDSPMSRASAPAVYQCPDCAAFLLQARPGLFHFSGRPEWSDDSPSTRYRPLVKCPACLGIFWLEDIEPLGELQREPKPSLAVPAGWESASYLAAVDFDDVTFVLQHSAGLGHERLVWLRRHIWWSLNDRQRTRSDGTPVPDVPSIASADEQANQEALLALLQQCELQARDRVDAGELLRQLGRFDEAIAVLRSVVPDGHSEVRASKIERLARKGDRRLGLLRGEA
jgi:hypothetical protein